MTQELLTTKELSDELGIPVRTLTQWRYLGDRGPQWLKLGGHVRYRRSDVDAWLAAAVKGTGAAA